MNKNHFIYTSCAETRAICQPLFSNFDINMFNYYRFYKSGHLYGLITTPELVQHHFSNDFVLTHQLEGSSLKDKFHFILIPDSNDGFSQVDYDYRQYFDVSYPLYLYECEQDYFDLYFFHYSGTGSFSFDHYFSNFNHLEKWKLEFKEIAADLLNTAKEHRILIPEHRRPNSHNYKLSPYKQIPNKDMSVQFTKREYECLFLMVRGQTAKEIGLCLDVSPRTVESHIENIKVKLDVSRRSQLISKVMKLGLLDIVPRKEMFANLFNHEFCT